MSHWKDFIDPEAHGGRYLPWREVARTTGLSRTTAWRLQKRDDFPAPYAISPGRVGYREQEVEAWRVSRDHRGGRAMPRSGPAPKAAPTAPSPSCARDARPAETEARPQCAAPISPPPLPARDGQPTARAPQKPGPPRRRRSEHARAIAQQMLFDF
jgi:predicted DNA-binding transcriptional regulator AlpA